MFCAVSSRQEIVERKRQKAEADDVGACTEMLALLSMVSYLFLYCSIAFLRIFNPCLVYFQGVSWAADVSNRVDGMRAKVKEARELEIRAVKAEEDLRSAKVELERLTGQSNALAAERDSLKNSVDSLQTRVSRRNTQLRQSRKALRKGKKILDLTEERCYQMGYDDAILKANSFGLDHTLLLDVGMADPVGRDIEDAPLVVSSGEDEELSE